MRVIPFLKAPAFSLYKLCLRVPPGLLGTPECLRCLGCPKFTVHLRSFTEDRQSPGQIEVTSGATGTAAAVTTRTPGTPTSVSSGTRPPADNRSDERPGTPASGILRFKVGKCIKIENHALSSILRFH